MTQEDKELLLKDLSARLPYGVKCNVGDNKPYTLSRIDVDSLNGHLLDFIEMKDELDMQVYLSEVKPYLSPLSSMSEEQKNELTYVIINDLGTEMLVIDWYNKNHFDYRGLIERGLALEAPEGMYN